MRRYLVAAAVAGLAVVAQPAATASTGRQYGERSTMCTVTDGMITELSGMASDGTNLYVINDGGDAVRVYVLAPDCSVRRVITAGVDPYDPEDLARGADGTLWLADTGDNSHRRATVALLAMTPSGRATVYRLTYPDGPHDAEALLLGKDGTPYLVTKDPLGMSGVYRPDGSLASPGPTPLRQVGSLRLGPTHTPGGPLPGEFGSVLVTGGAVSADGTVVALRTYTDAYLYPAPDGDVPAALRRTPKRIPLPDEQQGEAIAFRGDGTLLAAGEGKDQPITAVPGAVAAARADRTAESTTAAAGAREGAPAGEHAAGSEQGSDDLWWYVGGGTVLAGTVVLLGGWALRRSRRG